MHSWAEMHLFFLLATIIAAKSDFNVPQCQLPLDDLKDIHGNYKAVFTVSDQLGACDIDHFTIGPVLGHGNFGVVTKAKHNPSGRDLAIKFQQHESDEWYQFNRNEECIQQELSPFAFIAEQFCTIVLANGTVGYVMEYIEGNNLRHIVKGKVNTMKRADLDMKKIMAQLAVTLEYLHRHHVVMADLKTGNIMITKGGDIKLIDFGLAIKTLDDGRVLKDPQWASYRVRPEHANKPEVDWYAYGLLLYEILNGEGIFEQLQGKRIGLSPLIRGQFCPKSFDPVACDFIQKFSRVSWDDIWGTTVATRKLLRKHPFFDGFNWDEIDNVVAGYLK